MREQLLQIQLHINAPLSGIEGEGCTRDHLILGTKLVTCTDGAKEVPKNRIPLNPLYPRISSYPVSLNRLTFHIRLLLFVFVSILSPSDLRKVIVPLLSFVHFHVGELLKKLLKITLFCFSCFIFASYRCCFRRQTSDTLFVHQLWFFSPRFLAR